MRWEISRGLLRVLLLLALGGSACTSPAPVGPAPASPAPARAAAPTAAESAPSPSVPASAPALPPRPDRPVAKVTIGILGTTSDVVFYLAEEGGYFEHLRIEPTFERFDSGARMVASLATNQIEVGGGSPSVGLYNAIARGVQVKMVADRASSAPGHNTWHMFLRKDLAESGAIRDYADLRGRRIAVAAKGTTADVLIGRALERAGLTLADVEITEIPYPDMSVAMATGAIDVGVAPEPYVSLAVQRAGAVKWRGSQELVPNQVAATLMYTNQFIEQRPDVARDLMVAYLLGVRAYNDAFMKKQPEALARARDTILRRTDLRDPELLERIEVGYINPNGLFDRAALAADYQWFRQHGGLTESVDLDQIVDDRFVQYAVSVLGPYR
jgi:NitT/TauT family transport system substrate-binding protein